MSKKTKAAKSEPESKKTEAAKTRTVTLGLNFRVLDPKTGNRKNIPAGEKAEVSVALLEKIPELDANYNAPAKAEPKSPTKGTVSSE
jgi:hypothetical protein